MLTSFDLSGMHFEPLKGELARQKCVPFATCCREPFGQQVVSLCGVCSGCSIIADYCATPFNFSYILQFCF